jgi:hypothetical protein
LRRARNIPILFHIYKFEKLSGVDFFKELAYHSRLHHDLSRLPAKYLLVADEILNTLMKELSAAFTCSIKKASKDVE